MSLKSSLNYSKLGLALFIFAIAVFFHLLGNDLSVPVDGFYLEGLSDVAYFIRNLGIILSTTLILPRRMFRPALGIFILYLGYGIFLVQREIRESMAVSSASNDKFQKQKTEWEKNIPERQMVLKSSLEWLKQIPLDFPDRLRQHLIMSPAWHSLNEEGIFTSYLRQNRPDGYETGWVNNLNNGLKVQILIGDGIALPGGYDKLSLNDQDHVINLKYEWEHSQSYRPESLVGLMPSPQVVILIREHNEFMSRPETERTFAFLKKDFSTIISGKKASLLRLESSPLAIFQPESDFPSARAIFNPGDTGEAYLKMVRLVGESSVANDYYKRETIQIMGGSKLKNQNMLYSARFSWIDVRDAEHLRVELWWKPASGGEERLIDSRLIAVRNPPGGGPGM